MKTFSITNSTTLVMVDDEDYERTYLLNWYFCGRSIGKHSHTIKNPLYAQGRQVVRVSLASFIMNRHEIMFDHIDRNLFNNQKNNLREADYSQNGHNRIKLEGTTSKYIGVSKQRKKWLAKIYKNKKGIHIGLFNTEIEAARAYDLKAIEIYSEFANLNFR